MPATAIDLPRRASSNDADCDQRITRARRVLGDRVAIPGHHYQGAHRAAAHARYLD